MVKLESFVEAIKEGWNEWRKNGEDKEATFKIFCDTLNEEQ